MRAFMCLFAVLFLLSSQTVMADKIYRWTDANGQVNFGSQPPEQTSEAEEVFLRVQKPSSSTDTNTGSDIKATSTAVKAEAGSNTNEAEQQTAEKPTIAPEVAARNCRIAKEQKQTLSENFNRRFQQPDGSVCPLTDAERATKLKQMDDAIKQYCK